MSQSYFRQQRKAQKRATLAKPKPKEYRYMIGNWDGSWIDWVVYESKDLKRIKSILAHQCCENGEERLYLYEIEVKRLENEKLHILDIWMFLFDKYHPVQGCVKEKIKLAFLEK